MDEDLDLAFYVIVGVLAVTTVAIAIVILTPRRQSVQHTEVLPTTITQAVKLPPLAQTRLLTEKLVTLAKAKAETYWGGTRCTDIMFDYQALPGRLIAQARWYTYSNAPDRYLDCSITFNTDPTEVKVSFYHYCAALIHEYGHLAGFHEAGGPNNGMHSADPNNLMYPILREANIPKTCKVKVYVAGLGGRF